MFHPQLKRVKWSNRRPLMLVMMWLLCCALMVAGAQKKELDKEARAVERAADAVKILETVMASSDRAIASNLFSKAKAVAVFPRLTKKIVLIDQFIYGQGLVSRRTEKSGWGIPVFLNFKGGDIGMRLWGSETSDVILLFMTDESAQWLMKDKLQLKLKDNLTYRGGVVSRPVGKMSDEELAKSGIKVITYKITKDGFASMEALSMDLSPDNNLNQGVYWTRAREILSGQDEQARQHAPAGVLEFPRALARYSVEQ
jgi:lipid-binding SYLF domain-containing protein